MRRPAKQVCRFCLIDLADVLRNKLGANTITLPSAQSSCFAIDPSCSPPRFRDISLPGYFNIGQSLARLQRRSDINMRRMFLSHWFVDWNLASPCREGIGV